MRRPRWWVMATRAAEQTGWQVLDPDEYLELRGKLPDECGFWEGADQVRYEKRGASGGWVTLGVQAAAALGPEIDAARRGRGVLAGGST